MKLLLWIASLFVLSVGAFAFELHNSLLDKPASTVVPNVPLPHRQGGDTIATAFPIYTIPFDDTGTTTGYNDDYDETCPIDGVAPDVVYSFTPSFDMLLTVDLYGSNYDTKVYIYDEYLSVIDCNEDYYEDYVSKIEAAPLIGGSVYSIVVDGYDTAHGDYVVRVEEYTPCVQECPPGSVLENEPPLVDGYIDDYNGGCASLPDLGYAPFQTLDSNLFCAVSGWYERGGEVVRDTDWFTAAIPADGFLEIRVTTALSTYLWQITHDDCDDLVSEQLLLVRPCREEMMIVNGTPGDVVQMVVSPADFDPPSYHDGNEYYYVLRSNLEPQIRVESRSWSDVKALYR